MVPDIAIQKRNAQSDLASLNSATPSPNSLSSNTSSPERRSLSTSPLNLNPNNHSTTNNANNNNRYSPFSNSFHNRNQTNNQPNSYRHQNGNTFRNGDKSTNRQLSNSQTLLPIHLVKNQLLARIRQNESVIIIGETGCGKTTQIPKFIYEFYSTKQYQQQLNGGQSEWSGVVGISQPRRVAAISIATRVASEMRTDLGNLVGYAIRFEDTTSARTRIKYMTDGILLREAISDPLLSKYRVIILDEAHERTVQTDVLFGVVKKAQRLRNLKRSLPQTNNGTSKEGQNCYPLKLIVMSATMDVDHFSRYFNNAPVYYIVGRTYPIETFYTQAKQDDYVMAALTTIFQIHQQEDELAGDGGASSSSIGGDIVVFCTGQEEIEAMIKTVNDLLPQLSGLKTTKGNTKTLKPFPLYAALPTAKQQQIFTRSADCFRRVIFATNIAETSVTIPNIRFVVDSGKVKSRVFNAKTGLEVMRVETISKAQACQRSGRAGRVAPGQCYRLYTRKDYRDMKAFPTPEIQKCNLSNVLLQLIAIGVEDVANFDFVDPPSTENIDSSLTQLLNMKAIEIVPTSSTKSITHIELKTSNEAESTNSQPSKSKTPPTTLYRLTTNGRQMVTFPVDPRFAALIIASQGYRCTDEILIIIAMLSVDSIFYVPSEERELALNMHKKFASPEGDLIKLLTVFRRYKEARQSPSWCRENFLRPVQLKMAMEIRHQLMELCKRTSIPVVSCGASNGNTEPIRRCLAVGAGVGVGLGANIALLQRDGDYRTVEFANKQENRAHWSPAKTVYIHPSSCLFGSTSKPECLLFVELVHTTKSYMRNMCVVDQQWLLDYGSGSCHQSTSSHLNTV